MNMNIVWTITAIIMVFSLSLYLKNWFTIARTRKHSDTAHKAPKTINLLSDKSMPPIAHQTAGVIFFIITCVVFATHPSSIIFRSIGIACSNATTFIPFYVHHRLFQKGQNKSYISAILSLVIIITIITIASDYLRQENSFFDGFKQGGNAAYYAFYFTGLVVPLTLNTMTAVLFHKNIYQYRDGLSIARRTIGFTAFLVASLADSVLLINLFLSFWSSTTPWIDVLFSVLIMCLAFLLTIYVLPRKYYQKITQRIDMHLRQEEQEARVYLHEKWMRVVPVVSGYDVVNLDPKVMDAEIDQARYIAWTHKPTNRLVNPEMDADLLFDLLYNKKSLYKIGLAEPQPLQDDDSNKHNIAVMHILKKKEHLISLQSRLNRAA